MPDEYFEEPMEPCDDCYGTGEVPDSYSLKTGKGDPCKKCNGTGVK
jgi:DnaJ-class molecular chaperone